MKKITTVQFLNRAFDGRKKMGVGDDGIVAIVTWQSDKYLYTIRCERILPGSQNDLNKFDSNWNIWVRYLWSY